MNPVLDLAAWTLFVLLAGHALADGPLQSAELSANKRRYALVKRGDDAFIRSGEMLRWTGDPRFPACVHYPFARWFQALLVHGLIHGGIVALVTQLWWLGVAATLFHIVIDDAKATGKISHLTDQCLHFACKVAWTIAVLWMMGAI